MYTKLLIFALLGTSLVLASPFDNIQIEKFEEWINNVKGVVGDLTKDIFKQAQNFGGELTKKIEEAVNISKETAEVWKKKVDEFNKDAAEKLKKEREIWEERLKEAYKQGSAKYEEIKEQAKENLKKVADELKAQFEKFKNQVEEALLKYLENEKAIKQ